jgi:hypothetical protein
MITLNLRAKGDKTGPILETYTANPDGTYSFEVAPGSSYCIEVIADGYITEYFDYDIPDDAFILTKDFVLSPALTDEVLRVILTWSDKPRDVDLSAEGMYLTTPLEIYYAHKSHQDDDGKDVAKLDIDKTTGYGPETLSIYSYNYEFVCKIKNFSKDGDMGKAPVQIKVYHIDGRSWTFNIQDKGNPMCWCPFKFVGGDVIILNEYLDESGNKLDGSGAGTAITTPVTPVTPLTPPTPPTPTSSSDTIDYISTKLSADSSGYVNYSQDIPDGYKASAWGYKELTSDRDRELYTRIFNAFKNNGQDAQYIIKTFGSTAYSIPINSILSNGGISFLGIYTDDLNPKPTWHECKTMAARVTADFPGLLPKGYTSTGIYAEAENSSDKLNTKLSMFYIDYFSNTERNTFIAKTKEVFNHIASKVNATYSDISYDNNDYRTNKYTELQKKKIAKVIHDYIILTGDYGDVTETNWLNQTMYPALSESTCTSHGCAGPVCASYAKGFKYCCWRFGIACIVVGGNADTGRDARHEWNSISYTSTYDFSDRTGNKWQLVDLTWDDPTFSDGPHTDFVQWQYFNITTASLPARKRWTVGAASNASAYGDVDDGYYKTFPDNKNASCSSNMYGDGSLNSYNGGVKYGGF